MRRTGNRYDVRMLAEQPGKRHLGIGQPTGGGEAAQFMNQLAIESFRLAQQPQKFDLNQMTIVLLRLPGDWLGPGKNVRT